MSHVKFPPHNDQTRSLGSGLEADLPEQNRQSDSFQAGAEVPLTTSTYGKRSGPSFDKLPMLLGLVKWTSENYCFESGVRYSGTSVFEGKPKPA